MAMLKSRVLSCASGAATSPYHNCLQLFFDTELQWKAAYDEKKSCREKEALLDPFNQVIPLTPAANGYADVNCTSYTRDDGDEWYV